MLHKILTMREASFKAHNPYYNGIDSFGLMFTFATLRDVREALEFDTEITEVGSRALNRCRAEMKTIENIMKTRERNE